MEIKNKIALVTGGANGIGFAYAKELLRNEAAHVAILDLANSNGEESAEKLNTEFGKGRVIFIVCDVTKSQELEDGFAKTAEVFGGLDIVINNAGIMDDSKWELMVDINLNAVVRGTLLGYKLMGKDQGGKGGTIVNIASVVGLIPSEPFPIYASTKHAIIGLSRSFAMEHRYERTGVRVLTMCPDVTDTQLITKRFGRSLDTIKSASEEIVDQISAITMQSVEDVAEGVMHMLRVGENGSFWLTTSGEPVYEIEIPDKPIRKVSTRRNN